MRGLFDCNPVTRTADEWRALLGDLIDSLSVHLGRLCRPTSWFVHDDRPGYTNACNCVDFRAIINEALALEACGVVGVTVNFGEAAWASCDLLVFASGRRVKGPEGMDLVAVTYDDAGWSGGWVVDSNGEWVSHTDDARWRAA
jgi:hypothetical protein